ncbi:HNH/ENDO VII family nuclease [Flavobacterium sp.]|uniref:HNH/ENDO VII family nuclease n=1 Tax=Flavobacterium sp. TaxID=239 RepID=UPI0040481BD5
MPIGPDGKSLNLHHMIQNEGGSLAEMTETFHKTNHKVIHINPNTTPSGINRNKFNKFRTKYWKNRAKGF